MKKNIKAPRKKSPSPPLAVDSQLQILTALGGFVTDAEDMIYLGGHVVGKRNSRTGKIEHVGV